MKIPTPADNFAQFVNPYLGTFPLIQRMATAIILAETVALAGAIISPIITVSSGLFTGVRMLVNISQSDLTLSKVLTETDIVYDVAVIAEFARQKRSVVDGSTAMAIANLNEVLLELEKVIADIAAKVERHKRKWFHQYRSYNIAKERAQLVMLSEKMHHRFDMLAKLALAAVLSSQHESS